MERTVFSTEYSLFTNQNNRNMKKSCFMTVIILIITSCSAQRVQQTTVQKVSADTEVKDFIEAGLYALEQKIVDDLIVYAGNYIKNTTGSGNSTLNGRHGVYSQMDKYTWLTYKCSEFDFERFKKNPSADNVLNCLKESTDWKMLMGKNVDSGEYTRMTVSKRDGVWGPSGLNPVNPSDIKPALSWLKPALEKADSYTCEIVYLSTTRYYYMLLVEGKPVFYNLGGMFMSAEDLASYLKIMVNNAQKGDGDINNVIIM